MSDNELINGKICNHWLVKTDCTVCTPRVCISDVGNVLSHISTALYHLQADGAINRKLMCDVLNEARAAIIAYEQHATTPAKEAA